MSMTSNKGPRVLIASIEARTATLEKGLARANDKLNRSMGAMEARTSNARRRIEAETATMAARANQNLAKIGATPIAFNLSGLNAATAAAKGAIAGMAVGALSGLSLSAVQQSVAELAKIKDVAERTGASSRFIQELTFAVKQSGGEATDAASGLQKFAVNVSKAAAGGGDLAKVFEANGVAIRNAAGELRPLDDLLGAVADLVKNAENEQDALNIATLAFGRNAGPALVVALKDGRKGLAEWTREANKAGAVIEDRLIDRAAALDDEFTKLGDRLSGIGKRLAVEFGGPVVETGMKALLGYLNEIKATIEDIKSANIADLLVRPEIRDLIGGAIGFAKPPAQDATLADFQKRKQEIESRLAEAKLIPGATAAGLIANLNKQLAETEERIKRISATPLKIEPDYQPSRVGYTAGGDRPTIMPSEDGGSSAAAESAVFRMISKFESFIPRAKWDVNAYRVGYGSDTTTAANGTASPVTASTVTTMADATRDLNRRIGEFENVVRGQIGADRFNGMGEDQQAALTSIGYNYGRLPSEIVKAILGGGTTDDIAKAIRGLGGDNGGINANRRDKEADAFAGGATYAQQTSDKAVDFDRDQSRDGARRVEDINAQTEALNRQAQATSVLRSSLEAFDAEAEKAKILQRELRELKDKDIEATPARIAAIQSQANAEVAAAQRRVEAEKRVERAKELAEAHQRTAEDLYMTGRDTFKGMATDLLQGASAAEIFSNALSKIADKLLDMILNNLFASAFGPSSGAGGGIFGGLATLLRGFSGGGFTGFGGVHEPAGVVHKGEVVWSQKDVARAGGVSVVEGMRRGKRGYAQGGAVAILPAVLPALAAPAVPSAASAMEGGASQNVSISMPVTVNANGGTPEQNADLADQVGSAVERQVQQLVGREIVRQTRPGGSLDHFARRQR